MNQKRSWPGVPNKYSVRLDGNVIRPKSMATVVVVLRATPVTSSTPMLRSLSVSSVRSGRISLIAETRVVLPTPNPPATRILVVVGGPAPPAAASECSEPIQNAPQQPLPGYRSPLRRQYPHRSLPAHIPHPHPSHPPPTPTPSPPTPPAHRLP